MLANPCMSSAQAPVSEYQIKAAFLYNFARFVEWPQMTSASVRFCVYGRDPFGSILEESLQDKTIHGRRLEIRRLSNIKQVEECHVLFVSASSEAGPVLHHLSGRPILTVSEQPGFTQSGGMINFVLKDKKIHFEINPQSAASSGLKISSQLLRLALIVKGNPS